MEEKRRLLIEKLIKENEEERKELESDYDILLMILND